MSLFLRSGLWFLSYLLPTPSNYYHAEFCFEWLACMHTCSLPVSRNVPACHTQRAPQVWYFTFKSYISMQTSRFAFARTSVLNMEPFIPPFPPFSVLFICLFLGVVAFSGGHWPVGVQVSLLAVLPTQDGTKGSLHASGPGAKCGPWLASKADHYHWSQASPRKRLHLSNHAQLLAPPQPQNLIYSFHTGDMCSMNTHSVYSNRTVTRYFLFTVQRFVCNTVVPELLQYFT